MARAPAALARARAELSGRGRGPALERAALALRPAARRRSGAVAPVPGVRLRGDVALRRGPDRIGRAPRRDRGDGAPRELARGRARAVREPARQRRGRRPRGQRVRRRPDDRPRRAARSDRGAGVRVARVRAQARAAPGPGARGGALVSEPQTAQARGAQRELLWSTDAAQIDRALAEIPDRSVGSPDALPGALDAALDVLESARPGARTTIVLGDRRPPARHHRRAGPRRSTHGRGRARGRRSARCSTA